MYLQFSNSFNSIQLGLNDWDVSDPLLAQVLVQSQAEYLESLKQKRRNSDVNPDNESSPSTANILNDENLISLPSTSSTANNQHIL